MQTHQPMTHHLKNLSWKWRHRSTQGLCGCVCLVVEPTSLRKPKVRICVCTWGASAKNWTINALKICSMYSEPWENSQQNLLLVITGLSLDFSQHLPDFCLSVGCLKLCKRVWYPSVLKLTDFRMSKHQISSRWVGEHPDKTIFVHHKLSAIAC